MAPAQAQETEGLSLRLSPALDAVMGAAPRFREESAPLRLAASGSVGMTVPAPVPAPAPTPSPRPDEYPLRLSQALLPQAGAGRQPRWSSRQDWGLDLQPTRRLDMPGAAGLGAPAPMLRGGNPSPEPAPPGDQDDMPAIARRSMPPPSEPAATTASADAGDGGGLGWTIPPIRWGGSVGYNLRRNSDSSGTSSLDQVLNTTVRGSSYIYAPWMATVSGALGMVSGTSQFNGASGQSLQTQSSSLVGNGNLDLFPSSRFPFSATVSRSDSRVMNTLLASNYTDTRIGLRQSYRSEDSLQNATGGFDYSVISGQAAGSDTVSAVYGSYTAPLGPVNNALNGRLSVSQRQGTGEGSNLFALSSSHSYSPEENLSFQAFSNYTDNDLRSSSIAGGPVSQFRGQFLQLGTSASWRPEMEDEDDYPLTLSAGLNYAGARTGNGVISTQTQRISGTTAAYYRFSPNLSVNGSGAVNQFTSSTGQSQMLTLVNGAVTYSGDPLTFGNFSYNWNTGGNASWQGGGGGTTASSLYTSAQASHSLSRNFTLSPTDSIALSLAQSGSLYQNQQVGSSSSLTHTAMTTYRLGLGERFNGSLTGTFSDVMTSGANAQHYTSMGLGVNGFGQLSPRSSATANLMFNWSNQTQKATYDALSQQSGQQSGNQRMSLMGNASYTHMRFATVPGLRYTLLFTADSLLRDDRLLGDPNAQAQKFQYSLDNRLDYQIGMLDTRLSFMVTEAGGKKNALLFFQVTRQFGSR